MKSSETTRKSLASYRKAVKLYKGFAQLKMQVLEIKNETEVSLAEITPAMNGITNKLDSLSEIGETESLRLQMAMDRVSKMMSTLSNLLKKISDTQSAITQNMK